MDSRPRNIAQLTAALGALQTGVQNEKEEHSVRQENTNTGSSETAGLPKQEAQYNHSTSTKGRAAAYNLSTSGLLTNLTATCQQTNAKLDTLNDQMIRVHTTLEKMVFNQERQLELLATICRHTLVSGERSGTVTPASGSLTSGSSQAAIKDFGYSSIIDLLSDMVAKLIAMVEVQVSARGKRYRSSRDMTPSILSAAVSVACKATFRKRGETMPTLTVPAAKSIGALNIAKYIGSTNGIRPVLNPLSFKQIMDDPECRTMTTFFGDVIVRLCKIRAMMPYYEADILNNLEYPYVDQNAEVLCTWSSLKDRAESAEERKVIEAPVTKRKRIGELLAGGCSVSSAINSVLTT